MKSIVISVLMLLAFPTLAVPNTITPGQVLDRIQHQGVKRVVDNMASENATAESESEWEHVVKGIASGDDKWLKLASVLAPATDAGFAEDLGTALAQAMPYNVSGVMSVLNDSVIPVSTKIICSMPLYNETVPERNDYFVKTVQALYKNNTVKAKKCLSQLISVVGMSGPFKEVD
ncbi:hypothetical protein [Erwinia sp. JUb26]|uniref:hypothetical protein n=1 Tax=Erwinia sp. JUb26 TaxID=2485126 RepID=UPI000F4AD38F|nr:hypothetical protein [Erwinia sp. JUb26]